MLCEATFSLPRNVEPQFELESLPQRARAAERVHQHVVVLTAVSILTTNGGLAKARCNQGYSATPIVKPLRP